jgi:hypothetical protein
VTSFRSRLRPSRRLISISNHEERRHLQEEELVHHGQSEDLVTNERRISPRVAMCNRHKLRASPLQFTLAGATGALVADAFQLFLTEFTQPGRFEIKA